MKFVAANCLVMSLAYAAMIHQEWGLSHMLDLVASVTLILLPQAVWHGVSCLAGVRRAIQRVTTMAITATFFYVLTKAHNQTSSGGVWLLYLKWSLLVMLVPLVIHAISHHPKR